MATQSGAAPLAARLARSTARVILLLWAAFWTWFNASSAVAEYAQYGWGATGGHLLFAAIAVVVFVAAWWLEAIAGAVLVVIAILSALAFGGGAYPWRILLTLSAPALIAGVLLLASWALRRDWGAPGGPPEPAESPPGQEL